MTTVKFDRIAHIPPDLFDVLVEVIPKLVKSKVALLDWFRQSNVPEQLLARHRQTLVLKKDAFRKHLVTREVLGDVAAGYGRDPMLVAVMRNVVRRVAEWDNFSQSYEDDRLAAEGLVARVRETVQRKDWFTRVADEHEAERRKRQRDRDKELAARQRRAAERLRLKDRFAALFLETDPVRRGTGLEKLLNDWFSFEGIQVSEPFVVRFGDDGKVLEQIDGVIRIDNWYYLVEIKWWNAPIGVPEVTHHVSRVFFRGNCVRGIFVSYSPFTDPAVETARMALVQGSCECLIPLSALYGVLDEDRDLVEFLRERMDETILRRNPLAE